MDIHTVRQELRTKSIYEIPLRVTYYARVSSESDEQLNSLGNQIKYYEDLIRRNGAWTFVPGYIDEGISGISTKHRENFNHMIDDASRGKFDLVITKEISRFARNTLDSIRYTRELLANGVGVFFQNDNINTLDEDSELRLSIMSSIAQDELRKLCGKEKLPLMEIEERDLSWLEPVKEYAYPLEKEASFVKGKQNRYEALERVHNDVREKFSDLIAEDEKRDGEISAMFEDMEYNILRSSILNDGVRTDGRKVTEIRPITCEVGLLPCTHGSALFTRGETQSLAVTTLGTVQDEQLFDTIDGEKTYSNFMLHYNFPPYSVGEVGRLTTGRREIGHGHLAQRALEAVIPPKDEFPYTIRVVSEIMESNGSSSMASVCGGCLSLMDAGVPIKKPVAGIAMGLITEGADYARYTILSDILGEEDHLGDMDFKVAGTKDGITAFQMDIKIAGVTPEIMKKALAQAKEGRMHILGIMQETLAGPRSEISELAPKILTVKVPEDKIGAVIGTGGKTIKSIATQSGAEINIEDDGTVMIYGRNNASAQEAKRLVLSIIEEPEVGKIYNGTVKRIVDFGAFIEILPGKEGLCHISKLARTRVKNVSDVLSVGQQVDVKLIEIDRMGRLNLSYIDAQPDNGKNEKKEEK